MEMICTIVYQLTRNLSPEDLKKSGFDAYYVDHTTGLYPVDANGVPFSASIFQSITYDNILRLVKDPDVCDVIRYLREREIVHYQRFGEALRIVQDNLNSKNFYAFNPSFDTDCACVNR